MKLQNIKHIGIIGTGMIGASLAALFTGNGYKATMYAVNDTEGSAGMQRYDAYYKDLIEKGMLTSDQAGYCRRLADVTQSYTDLADAEVLFECVVEDLKVKHSVYAAAEKHCKNFRVLASTTSAISADDLAEVVGQKEKFVGAHPWNPPHLVPCVEVVKSKYTGDDALNLLVDVLQSVGREAVVMNKPAPGFVANRLQHALFREAVHMVEQGIASPQDIDRSLRSSFIPRYTSIGLFEHQDYAGLDMVTSIEDYLFPTLSNATKTPDLIRNLLESGNLGYKTGRGVLDWSNVDIDAFRRRASEPYLKFFNWSLPKK